MNNVCGWANIVLKYKTAVSLGGKMYFFSGASRLEIGQWREVTRGSCFDMRCSAAVCVGLKNN